MEFRSADEQARESNRSSSVPSIQELTQDTRPDRGQKSGPRTPQECERRFGLDMYMDGQEIIVQRLVQSHGANQVQQWADEGMTIETMGKPRDMRAFRERQKNRPAEVPMDSERRNAKSVQRSRGAHHEASKAGDTQVPDSVRDVISSSGRQLDTSIQHAMEERMGDTLGDVRIHTGPRAAKACEDINARAFTVGNHVAFNHGEYAPTSLEGQYLLAHELTHVRQQNGQSGIHRMPKHKEIVNKLREVVQKSDRYPGDEAFEGDLEETLEEINDTWLRQKLEENSDFTVEDVKTAMYAPGPDEQLSRELALLLQTDKWEAGTTFDKGVHDWKHIVARHVHPDASGEWPIDPGSEISTERSATAFPSQMDESTIKSIIENATHGASKEDISIQANGYRTVKYDGTELPSGIECVKIVYDSSGQIVTAYPVDGDGVEELP
ncbi:eCIS core domain-containing protein [Haloferax larsenii]|nr:DUF4157 domain-containing protein [Haloferax larsenii]